MRGPHQRPQPALVWATHLMNKYTVDLEPRIFAEIAVQMQYTLEQMPANMDDWANFIVLCAETYSKAAADYHPTHQYHPGRFAMQVVLACKSRHAFIKEPEIREIFIAALEQLEGI